MFDDAESYDKAQLIQALIMIQPRPIREDGLLMNSDWLHRWYLEKKYKAANEEEIRTDYYLCKRDYDAKCNRDWRYKYNIRNLG